MKRKLLFLDGLIIPTTEAFIQTLSPGILVGRGVFETMRVYNGKIFALREHLIRLTLGLRTLKMQLPCTKDKIQEHLYMVLYSNKLKSARLRLTIWRAKGRVRMAIIAWPSKHRPRLKYEKGFKAVISDVVRDEKSPLVRIKSINYVSLLMARRKAKAKGNDEAILLNRRGYITEGSYTNIFLVKGGGLLTPSVMCGCLNGITRQQIIKIAKEKKIKCKEGRVLPADLLCCEEAFLTNSLIEVMPLTSFEGKSIGCANPGPVTKILSKEYKELVRRASA